ncbi:zf-TFIIB domain-containing protein [uncultured Thomasclavelia sp.]|uniref:TFIIB-type zinc ribbon-containing protein n=1 Tax=uncultured Thomasclavelia sp. TaxID=3025759 RepID=UPI0026003051|nr:zf-TFIIB domain-containing protein [uncultured Thomasclavelia sp.]
MMKCPVCKDVTLLMAEKHGVEIDYCPECRGIWLDRGELEKIIERSGGKDRDYKTTDSKKKKRKGFNLTDILEIFEGE